MINMVKVIVIMCVLRVVSGEDFFGLIKKRLPVAQCRASCLETFARSENDIRNVGCTTKSNWRCHMCWDYCDSLSAYKGTTHQMCSDDICLEGCKHACKFHSNTEIEHLTKSKTTIAKKSKNVVYGVYGLKRGNKEWIEIQQTADPKFNVLRGFKYRQITVVAVSSSGLLGHIEQDMNHKSS